MKTREEIQLLYNAALIGVKENYSEPWHAAQAYAYGDALDMSDEDIMRDIDEARRERKTK